MVLKGSKIRNAFLDELLTCLWFGNVDAAINKLQSVVSIDVRNPEIIAKLILHFERIRTCVSNYAMRKELGLRNSSNLGEKANYIVVSNRQKHNGMSWSNDGSGAFAAVSAAAHNGQITNWIYNRDINLPLRRAAA